MTGNSLTLKEQVKLVQDYLKDRLMLWKLSKIINGEIIKVHPSITDIFLIYYIYIISNILQIGLIFCTSQSPTYLGSLNLQMNLYGAQMINILFLFWQSSALSYIQFK